MAGCSGQVRRRVCRPGWSDTHNGFRFAACPLSGGFRSRESRFLSIDTHRGSKLSNPGRLSQQVCQQTRTCQRRKRRVRGVERGQRSQPAWLRAHPGRRHFQLEKTPRTQTPANVWDTRGGSHTDGVNEIERREVTFLGVGSPLSTVLELSPGLAFALCAQFVPSYCTNRTRTIIIGLGRSYATHLARRA